MKSNEKNKSGKNFFKKVDPISFALVVLLGASATFAAFQLAWNNDTPVLSPGYTGTEDEATPVSVNNPEWLEETVISPLETTDVAVMTTFFDVEADSPEAIMESLFYFTVGSRAISEQSWGTSFSDANNDVVNVVSVLSGVVTDVWHDEALRGNIVTITHENGVQTVFTGLYNPTVSVGDEVAQGTVLGVTGLSLLEPDSGNVVHLEFIVDGENVNPETVIGQLLSDL